MNKLETVEVYLRAGLAVIPLWPDKRKNPKLKSYSQYTERLPTAAEWERWLTNWPDCNVGLITGYWRNMVALDFDDMAAFQAWNKSNASFTQSQATWIVRTGRGVHVWFELTTLLIPGKNDSEEELNQMNEWVVQYLGPNVPMHFTAFHPDYKMRDIPATPETTLTRARKIAITNGVH